MNGCSNKPLCVDSVEATAVCLKLLPAGCSKIRAVRTITTTAVGCTRVVTYSALDPAYNPLVGYTMADEVPCGTGENLPFDCGTGGVTSIGAAGTIAAANTVQNLLAAAARKGYAILNTHATAELWIRNGAAAAIGTGFNLKAGDYYEFPQDIGSYDGVVTIISSTVNATFYVEEYK